MATQIRQINSPTLGDVPQVRFAVVNGVVFLTATVCHVLRVGVPTGAVAMGSLLVLSCLALPVRYAAATGLCAWAFLTGFVVNTGGQLTFAHDDLTRMLLLVAVGVLTSSARTLGQRRRSIATYDDARSKPVSVTAKG